MKLLGIFECSDCKCRLQPGDLIAVIGRTPKDGWSLPTGRADAIFEKYWENVLTILVLIRDGKKHLSRE